MQFHQLQPIHKFKKRKRVGRGGKRGRYSGRGIKGQKARAGRKLQPVIREIIKKYPKLRGYKQKSKMAIRRVRIGSKSQKSKVVILNCEILEKKFISGEKITPQILLMKKLIPKIKGKMPVVKILGNGEITKSLFIEGCKVSKNAKEKIEKAGGRIE